MVQKSLSRLFFIKSLLVKIFLVVRYPLGRRQIVALIQWEIKSIIKTVEDSTVRNGAIILYKKWLLSQENLNLGADLKYLKMKNEVFWW